MFCGLTDVSTQQLLSARRGGALPEGAAPGAGAPIVERFSEYVFEQGDVGETVLYERGTFLGSQAWPLLVTAVLEGRGEGSTGLPPHLRWDEGRRGGSGADHGA